MPQTNWVELLGHNTNNCFVNGKSIVRVVGTNAEQLWAFESNEEAVDAFQTWLQQAAGK